MEKTFSELEKEIGIQFKNKDLLIQSFCHRSYLNENPDFYLGQNERLEFLGDAVLELVVTEYLYINYPDHAEGELTSWRAALVNSKTLGEIAGELNFNKYLLLSNGEKREKGKAKLYILANTFEAIIGAIYLDQGYEKATEFIEKNVICKLQRIIKLELYYDPKSELQEKVQEDIGITPSYDILKETGPDHKRYFVMGVFLEDEAIAEGEGWSKKEAEENAAKKALSKKSWLSFKKSKD